MFILHSQNIFELENSTHKKKLQVPRGVNRDHKTIQRLIGNQIESEVQTIYPDYLNFL